MKDKFLLGLTICFLLLMVSCAGTRTASINTENGFNINSTSLSILPSFGPIELANAYDIMKMADRMDNLKKGETSGMYLGVIMNIDPHQTVVFSKPGGSRMYRLKPGEHVFMETDIVPKSIMVQFSRSNSLTSTKIFSEKGLFDGKLVDYSAKIYSNN